MARNGDYHSKIGFPPDVKLPKGQITFGIAPQHVRERMQDLGIYTIPSGVDLNWSCCKMFEISVENNKVWKFGIRIPQSSSGEDLCLIVSWPDCRLVTLWLNASDDEHATLNWNRYKNPGVKEKKFSPEKFLKQAMRKKTRR